MRYIIKYAKTNSTFLENDYDVSCHRNVENSKLFEL